MCAALFPRLVCGPQQWSLILLLLWGKPPTLWLSREKARGDLSLHSAYRPLLTLCLLFLFLTPSVCPACLLSSQLLLTELSLDRHFWFEWDGYVCWCADGKRLSHWLLRSSGVEHGTSAGSGGRVYQFGRCLTYTRSHVGQADLVSSERIDKTVCLYYQYHCIYI